MYDLNFTWYFTIVLETVYISQSLHSPPQTYFILPTSSVSSLFSLSTDKFAFRFPEKIGTGRKQDPKSLHLLLAWVCIHIHVWSLLSLCTSCSCTYHGKLCSRSYPRLPTQGCCFYRPLPNLIHHSSLMSLKCSYYVSYIKKKQN